MQEIQDRETGIVIETETEKKKEGLQEITVYAQPELGRIAGDRDTGQRDSDRDRNRDRERERGL